MTISVSVAEAMAYTFGQKVLVFVLQALGKCWSCASSTLLSACPMSDIYVYIDYILWYNILYI